jgi:hypothetical protein
MLIADEAIFADASTPLLKLSSPQAVWGFWPLCQAAAYIRPTVVTAQTLVEPGRWTTFMDEAWSAPRRPAHCSARGHFSAAPAAQEGHGSSRQRPSAAHGGSRHRRSAKLRPA